MRLAEALLASLSILLLGWAVVPLVGAQVGVPITAQQGLWMSAYFFVGRVAVLYAWRCWFTRKGRGG